MTKTLTEQWREGTLPTGHYYCKLYYNGFKEKIQECVKSRYDSKSCIPMSCECEGEEVLAPVPSYEKVKEMSQKIERLEFDNEALEMAHNEGKGINAELSSKNEQLEKKLAIAIKALKEINVRSQRDWNEYDCMGCARKALYDIEMEGVK